MVTYPTFDSWYNEIEITAFRSERFLEHLSIVQTDPLKRNQFLETWLRAAFNSARLQDEQH